MRKIDIQTWTRREHFNVFSSFDYPHFNMCANVDLSAFCALKYAKNFSASVPRFAWGKYFKEGGCLKMPLNVQVITR